MISVKGKLEAYPTVRRSRLTKYTRRFEAALVYASQLHNEHFRKATEIPYVTHLLGVASLVGEAGGSEDEVIAALLHDAVEDQGGQPTLERIRDLFGDEVAEIVLGCSDTEPRGRARQWQRAVRTRSLRRRCDS